MFPVDKLNLSAQLHKQVQLAYEKIFHLKVYNTQQNVNKT